MKNIWVPLSGAIAQQRKVDTLANNIANANTTGFKRDDVVFREFQVELEKIPEDIHLPRKIFSPKDFYHTAGAENALVEVTAQFSDLSQGSLSPTQNPFDFAIMGKAFFEVLTPTGVKYTRKGNFNLNLNGELVTQEGFYLLQKNNPENPLPIEQRKLTLPPNLQEVILDQQGNFRTKEGAVLASLSVVEFVDPHALKKMASGFFHNDHSENVKKELLPSTQVFQGFLENSNVNIVTEMSELIKANRQFESIQRAIKTYDEMSAKGANEISKY